MNLLGLRGDTWGWGGEKIIEVMREKKSAGWIQVTAGSNPCAPWHLPSIGKTSIAIIPCAIPASGSTMRPSEGQDKNGVYLVHAFGIPSGITGSRVEPPTPDSASKVNVPQPAGGLDFWQQRWDLRAKQRHAKTGRNCSVSLLLAPSGNASRWVRAVKVWIEYSWFWQRVDIQSLPANATREVLECGHLPQDIKESRE
ncbi:hypothetical protein BJV78DRAFT_1158119 [Lactifluus subvellereus]|nr:hypothetical protein BJV78DRAFT_1158119 [Lactifluus subvellereus]